MTYPPEQVRELIRECWNAPYGAGQIALAEEAIRHADALEDVDLAFAARMAATEAYQGSGESGRTFVTFSWCLAEYDRDPGRRSDEDARLLRWYFKYVVGSLTKFPAVPLDRTHAVLDDMERRYRQGGHSLHAVYAYRHFVAEHVGDTAGADEYYRLWCTAPRDGNSDCVGCDPTSKVYHLANRGRDEEAVALASGVLEGRLTCREQPHAILTALLLPYVRTGRLTEAADAHRRAYRLLRPNLRDLEEIAWHVAFCARTGNEPRALEIVERHLDWLERAPHPHAAMQFAASSALALRRLAEDGHPNDLVRRRAGELTVAALADELTETASRLTEAFDARNGTTHQGSQIRELLSAEPLVEYLPLSVTAQRRTRAAVSTRPAEAAPIPATATPAELMDLAEEHAKHGRTAAAVAVWRVFDERFTAANDPLSVGRRADGRAQEHAERGDLEVAQAEWARAAELLAEAGDETRRQIALGKLGVARAMAGRADEAVALIEESVTYLLAHGGPDRRAGALSRLAILRLEQGRPEEALTALEEAAAYAAGTEMTRFRCELAVRRADCLASLRRVDEALAAYTEALAMPAETEVHLAARLGRSRVLRTVQRPGEAVDDLVEVVACCAELGTAEGGAHTRFELAQAYWEAGRPVEAAEAGEEAVVALDQLGAQPWADRCRYLLVDVYRELGENEQALALLDTLVTNLDSYDNLAARAQLHEDAGDILYHLDRDAEAVERFQAAVVAYAQAETDVGELRARRKLALALRWADRFDEAVAELETAGALASRLAPDAAEQTGAVWELAMLGYDGARLLAGIDRLPEALARISGVAEQFRTVDAYSEGVLAELLHGELLLRSGQPTDAEPILRAALTGMPRDADPVQHAAWLLAEALTEQGREAEAAKVRAEYGVYGDD